MNESINYGNLYNNLLIEYNKLKEEQLKQLDFPVLKFKELYMVKKWLWIFTILVMQLTLF